MAGSARCAIYFAPTPGSDLETFGCSWLGRGLSGQRLTQPEVAGIAPTRLEEITRSPRHYGFHGTLKAPFSLAEGISAEVLDAAAESLAGARTPFEVRFRPGSLGGFLALLPTEQSPALDALAAASVEAFEAYRAPLCEAEIVRRRAAGLTPRQDAYLMRYGYPYVLEEFRFHMTLTERLQAPERDEVLAILAERTAPFCAPPLVVDAISVFEQPDRSAPLVLRRRYPFGA